MNRYGWKILFTGLLASLLLLTGCGRSSFHVGVGSAYHSKPAPYYACPKTTGYSYTTTTVYHGHRIGHHRHGSFRHHHGHRHHGYGVHHGHGYGYGFRHHRSPRFCY